MAGDRQSWRIDRAGSLDRLRLVSEPLGAPGPGEARVAIGAIGLNFADIFACLGLYLGNTRPEPSYRGWNSREPWKRSVQELRPMAGSAWTRA